MSQNGTLANPGVGMWGQQTNCLTLSPPGPWEAPDQGWRGPGLSLCLIVGQLWLH